MVTEWLSGRKLLWHFALASLAVTILIGIALAWLMGEVIQRHAIEELMEEAQSTVTQRVLRHLSLDDLGHPMVAQRYVDFQRFVEESVISQRTARIKVWDRDGVVIYSGDPTQVGQAFPIKKELATALAGGIAGELSELQALENAEERSFGRLLEVYVPIVLPGSDEVQGAFEIYQYYTPVGNFIESARRYTSAGLGAGLTLLYLSLFAIVTRGADTISRQQRILKLQTQEIEESYQMTLASLCASLDMRDQETEGHSLRVTQLAVALAQEMGMRKEQLKTLEYGALLHDLGKIGVADAVLRKPGPLNDEEWAEMRKHPMLGYQAVSKIGFLERAAAIVLAHHERYDGKGYPFGLAEEAIPLGARIFAVIDTYDAMTSDRPYRKAKPHEEAMAEIRRNSGSQFDPAVVDAFLRLADKGRLQVREMVIAEDNTPALRSLSWIR